MSGDDRATIPGRHSSKENDTYTDAPKLQKASPVVQQRSEIERRAMIIRRGIVIGFVFLAVDVLFYLLAALQTGNFTVFVGVLGIPLMIVCLLIATFQTRREKLDAAGYWMLIAVMVGFSASEMATSGTVLLNTVSGALLILLVGSLMLSRRIGIWLLAEGLFLGGVFLINRFVPWTRYNIMPQLPTLYIFVPALAFLMSLVFLWQVARTLRGSSIQIRLLVAFAVVALVLALSINAISALRVYVSGRDQVIAQLESVVTLKEAEIETWTRGLQTDLALALAGNEVAQHIRVMRQVPYLWEYHYEQLDEHLETTIDMSQRFDELFIMDLEGQIIVSTDTTEEGKDVSGETYFRQGMEGPYIEPPTYSPVLERSPLPGTVFVTVVRPIRDSLGQVVAVAGGRAGMNALNGVMLERAGLGETGETYLVGTNYALLTESRFDVDVTYIETDGTDTAIADHLDGSDTYTGYRGTQVIGVFHWLPDLQMALLAEQEFNEAFGSIYETVGINVGVALVAVVAAVVASLFVTRSIVNPLSRLAGTVTRIAEGDLDRIASVERDDEVGALAKAFNSLTSQLRGLIASLEHRVADRTVDLERRSLQLEAASQVARDAAAIRDIDQLLDTIVHLISDQFGFYQAGIFLVDEASEYAVLQAASSEGGKRMLDRGHQLRIGEVGIVGNVAGTGQPRISLDVGEDAVYFDNPYLPDTRSEMGLPLVVRGRVIGVLDVQSVESEAFSDEDVAILQTLADQVALAIENARLLEESQRALQELETLYGQQIRESWQRETARQTMAYRYTRVGVEPAGTLVSEEDDRQLISPISLRGETLGSIVLRRESETEGADGGGGGAQDETAVDRLWADEEIQLVEAVSEQVAQALESARLFREARTRAEEMAILNELAQTLTTRLSVEEVLEQTYYGTSHLLDITNFYVALYHSDVEGITFPISVDDGQRSQYEPRSMGNGLTEYVIRNRTSVLVKENLLDWVAERDDVEMILVGDDLPALCWLGVPLLLGTQVLGMIAVQSTAAANVYDEHDQELLENIASQTVIALQNARLFEEAQKRLQEQSMLFRASQDLAGATLEVEEVAETIVRQFVDALGAHECTISLFDATGEKLRVLVDYIADEERRKAFEDDVGLEYPLADYPETARMVAALRPAVVQAGDPSAEPKEVADMKKYDISTRALIPVAVKGRALGIIELDTWGEERHYTPEELNLAMTLANQGAVSLENARLFDQTQAALAETEEQARRLALLNEMGEQLSRATDLTQVLDVAVDQARQILTSDRSSVALLNEEGDMLRVMAVRGAEGETPQGVEIPLGDSAIATAIQERRLVTVTDVDSQELGGMQSYMVAPLMTGGRVIGTLNVGAKRLEAYSSRDEGLMLQITSVLSASIENRHLFEEAQIRAEELAVLNELAQALTARLDVNEVLEETLLGVSRLLDTSSFYVAIYDSETDELSFPLDFENGERRHVEPRKSGNGISEYILRTQEPVLVRENLRAWAGERGLDLIGNLSLSWLGVPLLVGGQVLGVMAVQDYEATQAYDERDLDLLTAVASQTAIALQNAHLFAETQDALAETESLYRASRAIGEATLDTVLERALIQYAATGDVDAVRFVLFEPDEMGEPAFLIMREGWRSDNKPEQPYGTRLPMADYPLADLLVPNESIIIEDILTDPRLNSAARTLIAHESGLHSLVLVPITAGERRIGMLVIGRLNASVFRDELVLSYETLAGQAAVAFERMRLFEETRRRAVQLEAAAEVARDATAILDVGQLLDETVDLISEQFGFYHAGVFLVDDVNEYAVLRAASSEGGERMLARGHRLKIGQVGVVGHAAGSGEPRIALDVGSDAVYFDNPDMPNTRSEMALPLTARGRVIGVLDVQSTEANAFSDEDVAILQTMADQLATAIENARLFSETEQVLEETRELFEASQSIGAATDPTEVGQVLLDFVSHSDLDMGRILFYEFIGEKPSHVVMAESWVVDERPLHPLGTRLPVEDFSLSRFIRPTEVVTVEDIHSHPETDDAVKMLMEVVRLRSFAVVPLTIGQRTLGGLLVGRDLPYSFSEKLVRNLWTLCGQAAIAIENLRLLEETRRRAQELEAINEVGRTLTSVLDPGILVRQIADVTKNRFRLHYVCILLMDGDKLVFEDGSTIGDSANRLERHGAIFDLKQPGLVTDAARTGQPVMVNDALSDPRFTTVPELADTRSELVVPIEVKGRIIGVLDVQSDRPGAYDHTDLLLLQSLASQAGVAIENARLFNNAERTAWREQAAREILAKVQTATDVESILQIAVRELGQALNAPRAVVQLSVEERSDRSLAAISGSGHDLGEHEEKE